MDDIVELDLDHELLLKSCIPLLQSRNSGVSIMLQRNGLRRGIDMFGIFVVVRWFWQLHGSFITWRQQLKLKRLASLSYDFYEIIENCNTLCLRTFQSWQLLGR